MAESMLGDFQGKVTSDPALFTGIAGSWILRLSCNFLMSHLAGEATCRCSGQRPQLSPTFEWSRLEYQT